MVLIGNMGRNVHSLSTYCMLAMVLGAFQPHFTLARGTGLSEIYFQGSLFKRGLMI